MEELNFGSRLLLALSLPFKVLFDGSLAARIAQLSSTPALPEKPADAPRHAAEETGAVSAVEPEADLTPALQLLSILQREGRFIDFLQEDMSGFGDADIGAAARVVQEGCKRGLSEYVKVEAIRTEEEGASVVLEAGYDAVQTRVTGNVSGSPPYRGTLAHHGWRVQSITLPHLSKNHDAHVVAPAEVEL